MFYILLINSTILISLYVMVAAYYLYRLKVKKGGPSDGGNIVSNSTTTSSGGGNTLDKVLTELQGPKVISTVTKSSYDWDVYKEKEQIEDDLSKVSKDGYLTKQDFLDRCDVRSFEKERDIRLRNAVLRAGSSSSSGTAAGGGNSSSSS